MNSTSALAPPPPPQPATARSRRIARASASIGDRRIDLAYALLSIRSTRSTPPPVDFADEAAYAALLAGGNAFQAAQPVDESIRHASVLRAGWLHDLEYALEWACELLQLPPPQEEWSH